MINDLFSSCDLYYDKDSNSLKNHKDEVLAVFDDNKNWTLIEGQGKGSYCREYQEAIKMVLEENPKTDPDELIIALKKIFSEIKHIKIEEDELLKDAAIALDLNPQDIKEFQDKIANVLDKLHIQFSLINNPHVSTAYLMGYNRYSDLVDTIKTMSNYSYEFVITGFEILKGNTTNKDYLVLKLNPPENFFKVLKLIEQNKETVKFPGGFKTHISLFSIEKNSMDDKTIEILKNELQNSQVTLHHEVKIKPQAVSLFNNSKLLELRKRIRNSYEK